MKLIMFTLYNNISSIRLAEVESRTQGSRPKPRTQKNPRPNTALPRTDPLEAQDRNARGQGQRPRTQAQVFFKKNKFFKNILQAISKSETKSSKSFFRRSLKEENKKGLHKFSARLLVFSYIILKMNKRYCCRNRCNCSSHYMGTLQYKSSSRGSASVLY